MTTGSAAHESPAEEAERWRRQEAQRLWDEADCDLHSAAPYFENRGLGDFDFSTADLRLHRALRHPDVTHGTLPGIVGRVSDLPCDGAWIGGVHRTYLAPTFDRKADGVERTRLALGPTKGGAIVLRRGDPARILVAEGIETAAAAYLRLVADGRIERKTTVASAISASGLQSLNVPVGSDVTIAADHDTGGVGQRAAILLARRVVHECGGTTAIYLPNEADEDFADCGGAYAALSVETAFGIPSPDTTNGAKRFSSFTHDELALEMGREWSDARWVDAWRHWYFWDGSRWKRDDELRHMTRTRAFLRTRAKVAGNAGRKLLQAPTIAAVARLACSNATQAATSQQWDAKPWLLGTPRGVVDLRSGELVSAEPGLYITRVTSTEPAVPGTPAPRWEDFLKRIFAHDSTLIGFMQRVAGCALIGEIREHVVVFLWGQGANGKSTLLGVLRHVLGDYAAVAPSDLLLTTTGDRHPCDMAMLRGARLVIASELAPGRAWDEPKLKSLTGGDPITARFMRGDFFTYVPSFTLMVAGNHKPSFRTVDEATRRRVLLVPFLQNIPRAERDTDLPARLREEAPAILRWAIDGCLAWQNQGLNPPEVVTAASDAYLDSEDSIGVWLTERCDLGGTALFPFCRLYDDWKSWAEANDGPIWAARAFSRALEERGFLAAKSGSVRGFRGLRLRGKGSRS